MFILLYIIISVCYSISTNNVVLALLSFFLIAPTLMLILVIYSYFGKLIENFDIFTTISSDIKDLKVSLSRYDKILENSETTDRKTYLEEKEYVGKVSFIDVLYGNKADPTLNNVSFDEEELNNWYGRNISTTPACSKCKYAFFCGGGCQAHALSEGRGYKSPYCDGYPKLFHEVVSDTFINFEPSVTKNNV